MEFIPCVKFNVTFSCIVNVLPTLLHVFISTDPDWKALILTLFSFDSKAKLLSNTILFVPEFPVGVTVSISPIKPTFATIGGR